MTQQLQQFLIKDAELKGKINEHLANIDDHLKELNGEVRDNSHYRIEQGNTSDKILNLQTQFTALYNKTQRGYLKVAFKTKMMWGILITVAIIFLEIIKGYILAIIKI